MKQKAIKELNNYCHDYLSDSVGNEGYNDNDAQYYIDELFYECEDIEETKSIIISALENMIHKVKNFN